MTSHARFAETAALAGDPGRAAMLHALMDGRALTASELARVAGITPQTATEHLARMVAAGLLSVVRQGRHRYHRLASPAVARMIESIMQVASLSDTPRRRLTVGPRDESLRAGRTCYDHLAGRLGVALSDALVARGHVELTDDAGLVTKAGIAFLKELGIEKEALAPRRGRKTARLLCRPCLDWSERRPHLAGAVGTALCRHSFDNHWIRRVDDTRAVAVTPKGRRVFRERLGMEI